VVIERGEVRWAELGAPGGSGPGYRRPVVVVSADAFNASRIATVTVVAISSNTRLADAPGNVSLDSGEAGLAKPSVINVSQVVTIDKGRLGSMTGRLTRVQLDALDNGLRFALDLAI
jgi:mRNA interferase MazF